MMAEFIQTVGIAVAFRGDQVENAPIRRLNSYICYDWYSVSGESLHLDLIRPRNGGTTESALIQGRLSFVSI